MHLSDWPHLYRPATNPAAPALLLLHGTGGNEHDLVPLADRIAPGAALLSPRGLVSENGANRFFARLAEGRFDPAEVTARAAQLAAFLQAALTHHDLSPAHCRLYALGFSNGANIAATLLQLHPEIPLSGAILLRPMVVLDQPAAPGSLAGRRILLLNGDHDPIVPLSHPPRLAAHLRAGGAEVTTKILRTNHGITAEDLAYAAAFLPSPNPSPTAT
jgi:predicted esterase